MPSSAAARIPLKPLSIGVLAMDGAVGSALTNPIDVFRICNLLISRTLPSAAAGQTLLNCALFAPNAQNSVTLAGGLELHMGESDRANAKQFDVIIVPSIELTTQHSMDEQLARFEPVYAFLQMQRAAGVRLCASCTGTFLLAQAGILNGQRATTSWWLAPRFAERYPQVQLQAAQMVVESDGLMTSGAVAAMYNMLLRIVELHLGPELGQELVRNAARMLLVDVAQQSQALFASQALTLFPTSTFGARVDKFLLAHLKQDAPKSEQLAARSHTNTGSTSALAEMSVQELAEHMNMSPRTLLRRFREHYRCTPQQHLQSLKLERARSLLESSGLSIAQVVAQCGYQDVASFAKLYKRQTGMTPNAARKRSLPS